MCLGDMSARSLAARSRATPTFELRELIRRDYLGRSNDPDTAGYFAGFGGWSIASASFIHSAAISR